MRPQRIRPPHASSSSGRAPSSARSSRGGSRRAAPLAADAPEARRPQACILLWLNGGPSHIDTFDPKPGRADGRALQGHQGARAGDDAQRAPAAAGRPRRHASPSCAHEQQGGQPRRARSTSCTRGTRRTPRWCTRRSAAGRARASATRSAELPAFVSIGGPSFGAGFLGVQNGPFVLQKAGAPPRGRGAAAGGRPRALRPAARGARRDGGTLRAARPATRRSRGGGRSTPRRCA